MGGYQPTTLGLLIRKDFKFRSVHQRQIIGLVLRSRSKYRPRSFSHQEGDDDGKYPELQMEITGQCRASISKSKLRS